MRGVPFVGPSAVILLVGSVLSAAGVNVRADTRSSAVPDGAAEAAIEAMNRQYYNETDGRWNTNDAWWLTGIAFQNLVDYMLATGTQDYVSQLEHTIELQKEPVEWWPEGGGYFRADSTDDTAWWAMALISLYDLTNTTEYLDIARLDEEYIWKYWLNDTCDGGLIWNIPTKEYKNAIGNEQYVKLAASLHNRIPGDELYLQRAVKVWEWLRDSGMINSEKLVNDGLTVDCQNNGQTTWTYNQGVILSGLAELYRATGEEEYLTAAREIADAVIANELLSPNGILTEPCDAVEGCRSDHATFKGIFMKHLAELDVVLEDRPYRGYMLQNVESMWENARNATNDLYGVIWDGPFDKPRLGSQTSAISLLIYTMES
jgi:hypothetical protein